MKSILDASQKDEVKKIMSEKPIVIFFFMDGCGHCEATKPAWEKLSKSKLPYKFVEIESAAVPMELGITGFPHFFAHHSDDSKTELAGSKENSKDIEKGLKLKKSRALGGRRSARRHTRRFIRRTRKRLH
jgi:thiol-disulfide isomerase/thioredoxin